MSVRSYDVKHVWQSSTMTRFTSSKLQHLFTPLHFTHSNGNPSQLRESGIHRRIQCSASSQSTTSTSSSSPVAATARSILWFKKDLRVDDHPGLLQAIKAGGDIIPVFCFDPSVYEAIIQSPTTAQALIKAVASLKQALQSLGSDLIITTGPWTEIIPSLASSLGATSIITEEEIETHWISNVHAAQKGLSSGIDVKFWRAPLFEEYTNEDYVEFKAAKPVVLRPLDAPSKLPSLPSNIEAALNEISHNKNAPLGELPNANSLWNIVESYRSSVLHPAIAQAKSPAKEAFGNTSGSFSDEENSKAAQRVINALPDDDPSSSQSAWPGDDSSTSGFPPHHNPSMEEELATELASGEGPVLGALRSYLRYIETSGGAPGGSAWHWKLGSAIAKYDIPATPEGCFPAIFGRALSLGVVSRRRIYHEAQETLSSFEGRNDWSPDPGNFLEQLGYLLTSSGAAGIRRRKRRKAAAAALAAEAGDFHVALARQREGVNVHDGAKVCHYRWRGILTDYIVAEPPAGTKKAVDKDGKPAPAIMLVHGFGAFGEHWRFNVAALANEGFTVYAPTFPGYGRAEKPVVPYGQDLWRDFLAGFVDDVVRQPVVIAGNSIGGFISASLAADYPGRVAGLILVNSAGLLQEGYQPPSQPPVPPKPPLFVVEGVSRALFAFLEGGVEKQLKRVYPVRPDRADAWLAKEISRSARDPGALGVFRSVFYLPKPRALNWLVTSAFGGPTMVLQGGKDPLNDAVGRANALDRLCSNAEVVLLDAGHCPHDEVPDVVNEKIKGFVLNSVMSEKDRAKIKKEATIV